MDVVGLLLGEEFRGVAFDVFAEALVEDVGGHFGFEGGVAYEEYEVVEEGFVCV